MMVYKAAQFIEGSKSIHLPTALYLQVLVMKKLSCIFFIENF